MKFVDAFGKWMLAGVCVLQFGCATAPRTSPSTAIHRSDETKREPSVSRLDGVPEELLEELKDGPWKPAIATWYGPGFEGRKTASGERFDSRKLTVAHKTLPFGTQILFRFRDKLVLATVNDRGPFARGKKKRRRDFDLSVAVKRSLGYETDQPLEYQVVKIGAERKRS